MDAYNDAFYATLATVTVVLMLGPALSTVSSIRPAGYPSVRGFRSFVRFNVAGQVIGIVALYLTLASLFTRPNMSGELAAVVTFGVLYLAVLNVVSAIRPLREELELVEFRYAYDRLSPYLEPGDEVTVIQPSGRSGGYIFEVTSNGKRRRATKRKSSRRPTRPTRLLTERR